MKISEMGSETEKTAHWNMPAFKVMACGNNSIHGCRLQTTKSKVPQDETYSERHTNTFASILLHFKKGWKQASWTLIHQSDLRPTEGYASQRPSTVPRVPNLPGAAHALEQPSYAWRASGVTHPTSPGRCQSLLPSLLYN